MSAAELQLPPVEKRVVDLAIADLAIAAVLLPVSIWVTWKHGKLGTVCWPIVVSFCLTRFVNDIYLIVERDKPLLPGPLNITMQAAGICCLLLGIIGIVYEANIILPTRHRPLPVLGRHWPTKLTMAFINLLNTAGIAMATYGSAPSATGAYGVQNKRVGEVGNVLMLAALALIAAWLWPTLRRLRAHPRHPNAAPARWLLYGGMAALPFQVIRTVYNATYAFTLNANLDPFFGTFATKVVLLFLMQFAVAVALLVGGWKSMGVLRVDEVELLDGVRNGDPGAEDYRKK